MDRLSKVEGTTESMLRYFIRTSVNWMRDAGPAAIKTVDFAENPVRIDDQLVSFIVKSFVVEPLV